MLYLFGLDQYLPVPKDLCRPSPCGPFSICRVRNDRSVCTCLPDYIGQPPNCKPECVISSECPANTACINQRCRDPCPGTCGQNSKCLVTNHSPICSCMQGYTGDPFQQCVPQPESMHRIFNISPIVFNYLCILLIGIPTELVPRPLTPINYCLPSPCGPNSQCISTATGAICSCIPNYIGRPPNCRPECTISTDCPAHQACVNLRCVNPCVGCCGSNTQCQVSAHTPVCICEDGFSGDPFSGCFKILKSIYLPFEHSNFIH